VKFEKTRLLIDGDHIVFSAAAAVEEVVDWGEDEIAYVWADKEEATKIVTEYVDRLVDDFDADAVLFAVSNSKTTFRHDLFPDYKGNRKKAGRPIILNWLRRWTEENLDAKAIDQLEADDVIGISATHPKWKDWRQIIVTEDKDLRTIPGEIYFPSNDELIRVSPEEAELHFYSQALGGDPVDGFPGCPGIGFEGAKKLLQHKTGVSPYEHTFKSGPRKGTSELRWEKIDMGSYWEAVVSHYEKAGLTEEDALLQARIAYILRYENYNFKKGEVKLWEPK